MQVEWTCPSCEAQLRADSKLSLRRILCPKCKVETVVPKPDSPPRAAVSASDDDDSSFAPPPDDPLVGGQWRGLPDVAGEAGWSFGETTPAAKPDPVIKSASAKKSVAPVKAAVIVKPHAPRKQSSKLWIWIIAGSIAVVALAGVGLYFGGAFDSIPAPETPSVPKVTQLVFDWPETDRDGAFLEIDGSTYTVPPKGPLSERLAPGNHNVVLRRLGFAKIELTVALAKDQQRQIKPDWKPASAADKSDVVSGATGTNGPAGGSDRLVSEVFPEFKKWQTDLDAAKKEAAHLRKDVLIAFFSADRRDWCVALAQDFLATKDFHRYADDRFVLVVEEAKADKPDDGSDMATLAKVYHVTSYPTLVVTDAEGLVYGVKDYIRMSTGEYLKMLQQFVATRDERDKLLAATQNGSDVDKLNAARAAFSWLVEKKLAQYYQPKIHRWLDLAEKVDSKNALGFNEAFFLGEWSLRLDAADKADTSQLQKLGMELEQWKKSHKFRDTNLAAKILATLGVLFARGKDGDDAVHYLQAAADVGPTDPQLKGELDQLLELFSGPVSSGTGWVCAAGGYLMTNNHVVEGPGKIFVRIPGQPHEALAEIVATDPQRDIAIIHVLAGAADQMKPLPISEKPVGRAADVAAFGYPLGDELGGGLKFTNGAISALPTAENEGMYLLSVEVNPGNSGGPLCNKKGQVVGIVAAKTFSARSVQSYGMAIPSEAAIAYLQKNLPGGYKPAPADEVKTGEWEDVDKAVNPSVVMIIKRMH